MKKKLKVIVAHPGRQHSFRTASALNVHGNLFRYITTVYDNDKSPYIWIMKRFASEKMQKHIQHRKNPNLSEDKVLIFCQLLGLIEIFIYRKVKSFFNYWHNLTSDIFGYMVAKYAIRNSVDAVIMYDNNGKTCFRYLKKKAPNIIKILDMSTANRNSYRKIFSNIDELGPSSEFEDLLKNRWGDKRISSEIKDADYFLVPSNFVRKSLIVDSVPDNKIFLVPYGYNLSMKIHKTVNPVVSFIFVGQVIYAKGISTLMEAFIELNAVNAKLMIVGNFDNNSKIYNRYKNIKNTKFIGSVIHEEMINYYREASVFVLPSFIEGMTLSGLEAMACGLPIICTENSGINDIVVAGENGFVVPVADTHSLANRMRWFLENPDQIPTMGEKAYKAVMNYSWENYDQNLNTAVEKMLNCFSYGCK